MLSFLVSAILDGATLLFFLLPGQGSLFSKASLLYLQLGWALEIFPLTPRSLQTEYALHACVSVNQPERVLAAAIPEDLDSDGEVSAPWIGPFRS